ncbi:hypothetical protein QR680_008152 [Steinernema hermaphroditum]|uniref:C-type lectin domain-containing protein n=1 Tax=Steinernema hermaphroditum TaxID=289476 RepID=A0AA39II16_9BILA|nr:hypothetical protein QR680_008152 [Steinernema hermaphroditum]
MLTIDVVNLAPELEDYINKKAARNPLQVRNELGRGPWISKRALIDVTWYVMAPRLRNPAGWISAFAEEIREWAANNHSLPKRRTRQKDQDTQQYVEHLEQTIKRMCSISNELKVDIADARQEITNSNSIDDIKWNELIEEADKVLMESRDLINDLEDEVYNVRTSPKSDVKGSNVLGSEIAPRLPQLTLPVFAGMAWDWPNFYASFKERVDSGPYSKLDKFEYLRHSLRGEALSTISTYIVEAENYELALNRLKDHYGNQQLIISEMQNQLARISLRNKSWHKQKQMVNTMLSLYNQLKRAGSPEQNLNRFGAWKPNPEATPFIVNACRLCNGAGHRAMNCTTYKSVFYCKNAARKKQLCFQCLLPGHAQPECRQKPCPKCKLSNQKLEEEKRYEEFCEQKCTFHLSPDKGRDALTLLAAKQREFALHGTSAPSPLLMTHSSTAPSAPVKYIAPLPPINLRKFDGDPRKWNEFETTFHTTLDQNPHIGVAVKFAYLMGYLEGEARELLLHVTNALRLRYSLIPHELIAKDRDSKGVVAGKHACALKAFQEDKIAFDIENGQTCVLLDDFEGFKEKTGKRKAYLLGSSTHNDEGCDSTSNFDVGKIASKDCDMNEKLCEKMRELHTICQKIDDPDCIMKCPVESRGKYSNGTSFCCPDGKIFGETDGLPTCCPRGQTFQKKEDDRDMCRPKDTELKGVFDGKPVCCPSSMAHISGTSQCCPGSCTYKESFQRCLGVVNLSPLPTTQKELNQFCRDEGAEPVKIQNAAQNQDVASMATNPMIGLQIPEGVAWTKDNFRWTDGSVPSYTNFNLFEPNNAERGKGPEIFVRMLLKGGRWSDVNSASILMAKQIVCMAEPYNGS